MLSRPGQAAKFTFNGAQSVVSSDPEVWHPNRIAFKPTSELVVLLQCSPPAHGVSNTLPADANTFQVRMQSEMRTNEKTNEKPPPPPTKAASKRLPFLESGRIFSGGPQLAVHR